jgi:hypothetical protein
LASSDAIAHLGDAHISKKKKSVLFDRPFPVIKPKDLLEYVRLYEDHIVASGHLLPLSCDLRMYAAAHGVLGEFFGGDWIYRKVRRRPDGIPTYLHPPTSGRFDGFKHQDRVTYLAEHIVNLQDVPGFDFCIGELERDNLETGFAKMMAAGL